MICQKCGSTVADDLIFCTECGERLHQPTEQNRTVLMNDSVVTKISTAKETRPSSNLKWAALILALIAIPVSLFIAYQLFSAQRNDQSAANVNSKPVVKPSNSPNTKPKANSNVQTNVSNANENMANTNADWANSNLPAEENSPGGEQKEIWNERIEIAPGKHYAVPFKTEGNAKITGNIKLLEGESIEGYVYLQSEYDEHFPDANYKVFSFDGDQEAAIDQNLVKDNYVLVFVNNTDATNMIEGKVFLSSK
jgi:hypothetical protein